MTCRAPSSATTCTGTVTGQQLTYDAERRVTHWQSSPSGPTSSADYLYDGSGQRIEQVDTSSGTTTKVYYLFGGLEELDVSGSTSTLTKYYSVGGLLIGESVGGTISYLAYDGLGSMSEALSTSGTVTAAQLYGPYGAVRYSSGTMPTTKGFTGQRADALTGLDYYGARYYDLVLGQFTSADTKQGPNRFAYVVGNPETLTDPTGHLYTTGTAGRGGDESYAPPVSIAQWRAVVQRRRLRQAHYLSPNIVRGTNASGADDSVMAAATNVANKQDSIGGVSTKRGEIPSYGEGVVEFWYTNDAGDPVLMDTEFTKLWLSDGLNFHAEWEVLSGNPRQSGRTVVSIIQDWLRQQGDSFNPSRWFISVSIVTAYPTCNDCQNDAVSGRLFNTINTALGGQQIGFDAELFGLNSAKYRTGAFNPNKTYLNWYAGVLGVPDVPNYWAFHPTAWIPWWVAG